MQPSDGSDLCIALAAASRGWQGGTPTRAMLTATRAFLARAINDSAVLAEVAAKFGGYDSGAATWIAVTCGTAVERGAAAETTGQAVFSLLKSWLSKLPQVLADDPDATPAVTPEQAESLTLFQLLCQSTVTHLARLPTARAAMGKDLPLLERLGELQALSHGAGWVREALLKTSGAIVLLHPASEAGLRLNYTHVAHCFHLFSLLQTAVGTSIAGGREPDARIARVARGKSIEEVDDEAWWHYGTANSRKADLATSIWGEGLVCEIPEVEGVRVIVAWPPLLQSRGWDAGFLGPHLEAMPADVVVERALISTECDEWLMRLEIKARKSWWRS